MYINVGEDSSVVFCGSMTYGNVLHGHGAGGRRGSRGRVGSTSVSVNARVDGAVEGVARPLHDGVWVRVQEQV